MISLFGNNEPPPSLLDRLKKSVTKTRSEIAARVEGLLTGDRRLDPEQLRRLENALLAADLGVRTTRDLMDAVRENPGERLQNGSPDGSSDLRGALKSQLLGILKAVPAARNGGASEVRPRVVFVVGVNGTGKTTTIGKLAHRLRSEGASVLLCAGDTFRAAAIEQLAVWASRTGAELIKQKSGADPAAVVYDGLTAALARSVDVVIVDTAGRLHTKSNLMAELEKMKRTAAKLVPGAPHDVLLVLDATTGQNGLVQAREFTAAAGVTGIVLTKLDGTARGGIVVSIVRELGLPVQFVGTGEAVDDLVPFDAQTFVNSLFE
ncbi:MAG TPA: signal recognition particle-docking protein FtsY [Candidatus Acidoferrales bacterium]|jgi:fused signal recognition particle receptor